jgi:hypothetical protein
MEIDIGALKEEYIGHEFDARDFEIAAEELIEFAESSGETAPHYTDPSHPDFRAPPSYPARYHGRRQLPQGFPVKLERSFDAGKCVEVKGVIRAGDTITARSHIHDIYEKSGRSGGMLFVVHRMEFFNQKGELVSVVDWKLVQRLDSF